MLRTALLALQVWCRVFYANEKVTELIIDLGASDHMTENVACVKNPRGTTAEYRINLPNGETSKITQFYHLTILSL